MLGLLSMLSIVLGLRAINVNLVLYGLRAVNVNLVVLGLRAINVNLVLCMGCVLSTLTWYCAWVAYCQR